MDVQPLISWFLKHKRSFSFRKDLTPYKVWVSEVMLQQTRAVVVESYFERWMQKFPSIEILANAEPCDVIKAWEGLGYYSRARNLHKGAIQISKDFGGRFPDTKEELLKIKGIGPYTAGAILSFAFHKKMPAVDGNVMRVIARLYQIEGEISKTATFDVMYQKVKNLLPDRDPHIVMEALIELGATNCSREPTCFTCPLKKECASYQNDTQKLFPVKSKKVPSILLHRYVLLLENAGSFLVKKEENAKKVMADLFEFPYIDWDPSLDGRVFPKDFSIVPNCNFEFIQKLPSEVHTFTKYKAFLYPHHFKVEKKMKVDNYLWVDKGDLEKHPFSSGHRKIIQSLR